MHARRVVKAKSPARRRFKSNAVSTKIAVVSRKRKFVKKTYGLTGNKRTAKYPMWFQILAKQTVPDKVAGQYTGQISSTINQKTWCAHYKHLALIDLDNLMRTLASLSTTTPGDNSSKLYLTNKITAHRWRNAETGSACELEFFALYPRKDIPLTSATGTLRSIAPPVSNSGIAGGFVQNPGMMSTPITEMSVAGNAAAGIGANDPSTTPFMSPMLTANFKIVRLPVTWPDGRKSPTGRLEPGQEVQYTGHFRGPEMVSFSKYFCTSALADRLGTMYSVLQKTPLIMFSLKGTPSHDTTTKTLVGLGPAALDYIQDFSMETWQFQLQVTTTSNPITTPAVVAVAEQVSVVTAGVVTEALN